MAKKRSKRKVDGPDPLQFRAGQMDSDDAWNGLIEKYPDHPALAEESVYALPASLIKAINKAIPDFFTRADLAFEHDLTNASRCGFFRRAAIDYSPLNPHRKKAAPRDDVEKNAIRSAAAIEDMLVDYMQQRGESNEAIFKHFDFASQLDAEVEERRWGYAGWLVTSAEFRSERDQLKSRVAAHFEGSQLPSIPISFTGRSDLEIQNEPEEQVYSFLIRWGLQSLATWDLPVPLRPDLATPSLTSFDDIRGAGLVMFIPWYLLRDKNLSLADLAESARPLYSPLPLATWLDSTPKNWGHRRFHVMLRLFVYLELCLKRRYGDRFHRKLTSLDEPFGELLIPDANQELQAPTESIRKIRLEMQRRLAIG